MHVPAASISTISPMDVRVSDVTLLHDSHNLADRSAVDSGTGSNAIKDRRECTASNGLWGNIALDGRIRLPVRSARRKAMLGGDHAADTYEN